MIEIRRGGSGEVAPSPAFFSPIPQALFDRQLGNRATDSRQQLMTNQPSNPSIIGEIAALDRIANAPIGYEERSAALAEKQAMMMDVRNKQDSELDRFDRFDRLAHMDRELHTKATTRQHFENKQREVKAWAEEQSMRRATGLPSHIAGTWAGMYETKQSSLVGGSGMRIDKQVVIDDLQMKRQQAKLNRKINLEEHLTPNERLELKAVRDEAGGMSPEEARKPIDEAQFLAEYRREFSPNALSKPEAKAEQIVTARGAVIEADNISISAPEVLAAEVLKVQGGIEGDQTLQEIIHPEASQVIDHVSGGVDQSAVSSEISHPTASNEEVTHTVGDVEDNKVGEINQPIPQEQVINKQQGAVVSGGEGAISRPHAQEETIHRQDGIVTIDGTQNAHVDSPQVSSEPIDHQMGAADTAAESTNEALSTPAASEDTNDHNQGEVEVVGPQRLASPDYEETPADTREGLVSADKPLRFDQLRPVIADDALASIMGRVSTRRHAPVVPPTHPAGNLEFLFGKPDDKNDGGARITRPTPKDSDDHITGSVT